MQKGDQAIEEKVLTFKTISSCHNDQVANFIVQHHPGFQQASTEYRTRLYSIVNMVMIPVLRSQWSFALFQQGALVGAYIQIDLKDYLKTVKLIDRKILSQLFEVQQFQTYFDLLQPNLQRGQFLLSIYNVTDPSRSISKYRRQIRLIQQGLYLCKLGGWKNILFQTSNPIPFLKISAQVVREGEVNQAERKYLMRVVMNEFNLNSSPFHKTYAKL